MLKKGLVGLYKTMIQKLKTCFELVHKNQKKKKALPSLLSITL
jgi:hypothetical protein